MSKTPELSPSQRLEMKFRERSVNRTIVAFFLLVISMIILAYGLINTIRQFDKIVSEDSKNTTPDFKYYNTWRSMLLNDVTPDSVKLQVIDEMTTSGRPHQKPFSYALSEFFARLVLLTIVFFIVQVLIKLYRYNIAKADHFVSCADSLRLLTILDTERATRFDQLLKSIESKEISLDTPETPALSSDKPIKR